MLALSLQWISCLYLRDDSTTLSPDFNITFTYLLYIEPSALWMHKIIKWCNFCSTIFYSLISGKMAQEVRHLHHRPESLSLDAQNLKTKQGYISLQSHHSYNKAVDRDRRTTWKLRGQLARSTEHSSRNKRDSTSMRWKERTPSQNMFLIDLCMCMHVM